MNWKFGILIALIAMIVSILLIGFTFISGGNIDAPLNPFAVLIPLGLSTILVIWLRWYPSTRNPADCLRHE